MKRARKRAGLVIIALLAVSLPVALGSSLGAQSTSSEATYTVQFRNITDGQYLTPPNFAAHDSSVDVFQLGEPASAGVQAVAENGGVPILAAELTAAVDDAGLGVSGVGAEAPLAPGESTTWEFTTDANRFSLVSMVICTNDAFAGLDSRPLPGRDGRSKVFRARAFDAGTEINTENRADLVPAPFCGDGAGNGESDPALAENGVIRRHRTLQGVGDISPDLDWQGPVAEVIITRTDPTPTYTVTIENVTTGQYLTPPNTAIHDDAVRIFQAGQPASDGLQAVAENGGVPVLAAELTDAIDDAGFGVSTVGAEAPLAPGESVQFQLTSDERYFSFASMLICTNDGFAGLDSQRLPSRDGQTRVYNARAYDAGTEINTEARADLVPAPFCGDGGGTEMSNPALAEDWVVSTHRSIIGNGDLDPSFDWNGAVARVTITRG